jgi:TPR repeat protein
MKHIQILNQRRCLVYFAALLLIGAIHLQAADSTNNTTSVSPTNQLMVLETLTAKWQDVDPDKLQIAATNGDVTAQTYLGFQDLKNGDSDIQTQGVYWCRLAANQGFALAQDLLGWTYGNGRGVGRDYDLGEKWMRRAADQGLVSAEYHLGNLFEHEFDKSGKWTPNFQVAAEWYRKAADQGHVKAMFELADMYHSGDLGDDQRTNCIPWFLKAAALGNAQAQAEISELPRYYPNSELLKSVNTIETLKQGAEQGNLDAQFHLAQRYQTGNGVPQDVVEAFKWMQKAAQHYGSESSVVSDARYQLGLMYEKGEGVQLDLTKAHDLFLSAVKDCMYAGNLAMFSLGQMYETGNGVPQDDRKAAEFYAGKNHNYNFPDKYPNGFVEYLGSGTEAVESLLHLWSQGRGFPNDEDKAEFGYRQPGDLINGWKIEITSANAEFYLGEIYYQGKLVPKDIAQAADWFNKAAIQGSPEAMNHIGEMWAAGINGAPDPKEAANWYRKASVKGSSEAQYNLGLCYAKGDGVPANSVEAWKWLQLAAEQKFPNAAEERDKMQATMTADQIKDARTLADQINATGIQ